MGHFKSVFVLDSIHGLSTVSLDTLKQSKIKVAYSCVLLLVYVVESIFNNYNLFIGNIKDTLLISIVILSAACLPLYSLTMAVLDYKSKVSVAMNLEAIEQKIESITATVHGKNWIRAMVMGLVICTTVVQAAHVILIVTGIWHISVITEYVTIVHFAGIQLLEGYSMVTLMAKVVIIQRAITNGFSQLQQHLQIHCTSQGHRPRNQRRRDARLRIENDKKWSLLAELEVSLYFTENSIRNHCSVQIVWFRIMFEVMGPIAYILWLKESSVLIMGFNLLQAGTCILSVVYAITRMREAKEEALLSLTKANVRDKCPSRVKRQILAQIHRNRVPFSCGIFTVDSTLLATVLENSMFVITSMIGMYVKNG